MARVLQDYFGRTIRLTDERIAHILEHGEMEGQLDKLKEALQEPDIVVRSRRDPEVHLPQTLCDNASNGKIPLSGSQNNCSGCVCCDRILYGYHQERRSRMGKVKVWYDKEGDFLEVTFREAKGYMRDIGDDIFERVDEQGKIIGFAILNFSKRDQQAVEVPLEMLSLLS